MEIKPEISGILLESIEQARETFFITDSEGSIIYVNPAFEELTGYSRPEVLGKNARILKSGEHPPEFYREMWNLIKTGRNWKGRIINRRKDGTTYTDEQQICPVKDTAGKITHFLALRHDIARETQLEAQLNQSQKMESLGLLAGQISHDFNNLLTIIIGSMELIEEELKPGSVGAKLTSEILRSSKESAHLIKQLMVFARKHEACPVLTTLNEPLAELKILLDSLLGKGVAVAYSLAENLARVKIEPENLKQAVMNLAANARDAMGGSGGIMIKTYNAGPEGIPHSLPRGPYAVFEISDTGPGIPKEVLPRMFEPFFTTKPKGKGTGLGLSTVYGIVTQNGGQIFAANHAKGGAVFTIYFPAVKESERAGK
ncbi:MAG: PAS domain S-box protein [Elusimicrobiota bacterium]|nr:PAS domain S-box protein [Elusimicrobiota bacterium]